MTDFKEFAEVCKNIENISSSLHITDIVADFFKKVSNEELEIVTNFIMGNVFPNWSSKELGIGPSLLYRALSKASGLKVMQIKNLVRDIGDIGLAALRALSDKPKFQTSLFLSDIKKELTISEVFETLKKVADTTGKDSQKIKIKNLQYLFNNATPLEAQYIARLVLEELRIGVGEGIVRDAIALAFSVPVDLVSRGYQLTNDFGLVATTAKNSGEKGLKKLHISIFKPIEMMLAQIAPDLSEIGGEVAVEWKFDGARVQIHKKGSEIQIFSRKLENVTNSLPDLVKLVKNKVSANSIILDGEAVAIGQNGKPQPFQEILKRFRRKYAVLEMTEKIPLQLYLFDIMYFEERNLIDLPLKERRNYLLQNVSSDIIALQTITSDKEEINKIYADAISAGHEGIMLKNPESLYTPGRRGKNWLKIKAEPETLDLVVIGAEWGEGRRAHLLGSYSLACYDPNTNKFLGIGNVGTGITDSQLLELTELFKDLIYTESGKEVKIEPKIVFEVGYGEIQKSKNYESGYALRFPVLIRLREDKSAKEVDTLERIEYLYKYGTR
ncbi:MAG TPA: ATP-dependent DNA ligase [Methanosarcinales archaeon]|nr:ATP-dependent DNA ligase [Methanosarcinales archaeon]